MNSEALFFAIPFSLLLTCGAAFAQTGRDSTERHPGDVQILAQMAQLEQAAQSRNVHAFASYLWALHKTVLRAETPNKLKYLRLVAQTFEELDRRDPNNISYKRALIECLAAEQMLTNEPNLTSRLVKRYEEAIRIVYENYSDQELTEWAGLLLQIDPGNEPARMMLGKRCLSRNMAVIAFIVLLPVFSYMVSIKERG